MQTTQFGGEEISDDLIRVDPPSHTDQEFIVVAMESAATPETRKILDDNGKEWALKARSYRPAENKFYLLMRSHSTKEGFWLPEDEILLLTHY